MEDLEYHLLRAVGAAAAQSFSGCFLGSASVVLVCKFSFATFHWYVSRVCSKGSLIDFLRNLRSVTLCKAVKCALTSVVLRCVHTSFLLSALLRFL